VTPVRPQNLYLRPVSYLHPTHPQEQSVILAVDLQGGIENAWSNVATFVPKLAAALLILLVGYLVAKAVHLCRPIWTVGGRG
jgi:Conserved TM helix